MKQILRLIILLQIVAFQANAEVYILEGVYQGKDLYVMNPFSNEGVGFCVYEVLVNGQVTSDEINSSAFAVDLTQFDLNPGDDLIVTIRSKSSCDPKIINPEAISPTSTCRFSDISLNNNGELHWVTEGENGRLPFIIEHFKWNKWVEIGSVEGKGKADKNGYFLKIKLPDGENKIRIKQKDYQGIKLSEEVTINVSKPASKLVTEKVSNSVDFTANTHYELYSSYGVLLKTGYASKIDITSLEKGRYYLNYEKSFGIELKKK